MADQKMREMMLSRGTPRNSRRGFLKALGGTAAVGGALAVGGCDDFEPVGPAPQDPVAEFSISPLNPTVGEEVTLDAAASLDPDGGEIVSFEFTAEPAGFSATGETVAFTFDEAGEQTITLTVTDDEGQTATVTRTITVMMMEPQPVVLDFSNDFGVLNYAYALEQLEAAFYAMVVANLDSGNLNPDNPEVAEYFRDTVQHEAIHRDFLNVAISANGGDPIRTLDVDFSSVDFSSADSVLATAQVLEDVGVSAYNGAGSLLSNATFLVIAGKIVSVEGRHAAAIRGVIEPGFGTDFADLTELTDLGAMPDAGFDVALPPSEVLPLADSFIVTEIQATGLPM